MHPRRAKIVALLFIGCPAIRMHAGYLHAVLHPDNIWSIYRRGGLPVGPYTAATQYYSIYKSPECNNK